MTDYEAMMTLAERDGCEGAFDILDRNALARVIGKMTTDERELFHHLLVAEWLGSTSGQSQSCWLFTCDPRVIAGCIAKAIQKGKA